MCYKPKHKISLNIVRKLSDEREFHHKMLIDPNISVETSLFYKHLLYARQRPGENFLHPLGGAVGFQCRPPVVV